MLTNGIQEWHHGVPLLSTLAKVVLPPQMGRTCARTGGLGLAGNEVVCPDPVNRSDCREGVQLTPALEGVRDALTPRPGEGVLVWCCGRLHRWSQLLGHRQSHPGVSRRGPTRYLAHHRLVLQGPSFRT